MAGKDSRRHPYTPAMVPRRVRIRPLEPGDEREFLERVRSSKRLHRPWSYPPDTPEAFRRLIGSGNDERMVRLVAYRIEDGALVGCFGVGEIVRGHFQNAYLGYYAFEPFAGQGFMREGLELVVRYAFEELRLHRLQAAIQPENERSLALVRAAGFRREGLARRYLKIGGRWRDHELWAITVEDVRGTRRRT
jgi:[ribosomal protein S5]-alanine N-acetyltransferase